jgi:hypothetical protein
VTAATEMADISTAQGDATTPAQVAELLRTAMIALSDLYTRDHGTHQCFHAIMASLGMQLRFLSIGLERDAARRCVRDVEYPSPESFARIAENFAGETK